MNEGKPDIEPDAPMWRCHPLEFEQSIAKRLAFDHGMNLDQVIENDRARLFMKKEHFFDQRIAFEGELIEIVLPGLRRFVSQSAG